MQNGIYILQHKMLGTEYKLRAYNGEYSLYSLKDKFIKKYTDDGIILEHCKVVKQVKEPKFYDIGYYVGGVRKETIKMNASYAVCLSRIEFLKRTSHRNGLLKPVLI